MAEVADAPFLETELIFTPEHRHNHSSSIVERPGGGLLACWYHGSGECEADDVRVLGARRDASGWSAPFLLADTPGFPDTNPVLAADGRGRLWLFYGTQLDNRWESTLLQYKVAQDWGEGGGPPRWERAGVLLLKPDDDAFVRAVDAQLEAAWAEALGAAPPERRGEIQRHIDRIRERAGEKLWRRLGWMARCPPLTVDGRTLLPLYSDGLDLSLMAVTEDDGETWSCGLPLVGPAAIQPSLARRRDGTLIAFLRNNGPPPARILAGESRDGGRSWDVARPLPLPNPASSVGVLVLRDGRWLLCYNDTEAGRHSLAVSLSEDEGRTWPWTRPLERTDAGQGAFHYPTLLQARDGAVHVSYTYTLHRPDLPPDNDGQPARESIKHARFHPAWVQAGAGPGG